jgi:hypothetical protein
VRERERSAWDHGARERKEEGRRGSVKWIRYLGIGDGGEVCRERRTMGRGAGARKRGDTGADESGTETCKELAIRGETRSDGAKKRERGERPSKNKRTR